MKNADNKDTVDIKISALRILAALAVIWLHTNGTALVHPEIVEVDYDHARWFAVNYYLMRWGVPVFLMLTGALLLNRKKDLTPRMCLVKYVRRILFAVLLFGAAYAFVLHIGTDGALRALLKAPWYAVTGRTADHLWYCFILIGIYLILPVLKAFTDNAPRSWVFYVLVSVFVMGMAVPTVNRLFSLHVPFNIALTYPVFYVLCGYYMDRYRNSRYRLLLLFGFLTLLLAVGILAWRDPALETSRFDYNSPVTALSAVCLFGLFFGKENEAAGTRSGSARIKKWLWRIDRLCFGVYLIHPVFIQGLYRIVRLTTMHFHHYRLGTVLVFLIVTALSFLSCALLRLIPPMRKYVL